MLAAQRLGAEGKTSEASDSRSFWARQSPATTDVRNSGARGLTPRQPVGDETSPRTQRPEERSRREGPAQKDRTTAQQLFARSPSERAVIMMRRPKTWRRRRARAEKGPRDPLQRTSTKTMKHSTSRADHPSAVASLRAPTSVTALAKTQAVPWDEKAPPLFDDVGERTSLGAKPKILSRRQRTPRKTGHDNLSIQRTNPEIGTGIEPRARAKGNAGPRSRSCDHPTARERRPHEHRRS